MENTTQHAPHTIALFTAMALLLLATAAPASAEDPTHATPTLSAEASTANHTATIEPVVTDIPFLSGGVGEEEQSLLQEARASYNVHLLLAGKDGAYLSDVVVQVNDKDGNALLRETSEGPFFYMNLPQGRYTLEVSYLGETRTDTLAITSAKATHDRVFRWMHQE